MEHVLKQINVVIAMTVYYYQIWCVVHHKALVVVVVVITCPPPAYREVACMNNTLFCVNGSCSGSYCLQLQLPPCECTTDSEQCSVCCIFDGECTPTSRLTSQTNLRLVCF